MEVDYHLTAISNDGSNGTGDEVQTKPDDAECHLPQSELDSFGDWSDSDSNSSGICNQSFSNRRVMDEKSSTNALAASTKEVEGIISYLTRLTLAIRKSGDRSRMKKADSHFQPADHSELRQHLCLVLLAKGSESGFEEVSFNSDALNSVQERLITANLKRRNRFIYAQRHSQKLGFESLASPEAVVTDIQTEVVLIPEIPEHAPQGHDFKASVLDRAESPMQVQPANLPPEFTATSASAVLQPIETPPNKPAPSQVAKTNITSTTAKVIYPRPPPRREGRHFFKCPCCCQTLPDMFRATTVWK